MKWIAIALAALVVVILGIGWMNIPDTQKARIGGTYGIAIERGVEKVAGINSQRTFRVGERVLVERVTAGTLIGQTRFTIPPKHCLTISPFNLLDVVDGPHKTYADISPKSGRPIDIVVEATPAARC